MIYKLYIDIKCYSIFVTDICFELVIVIITNDPNYNHKSKTNHRRNIDYNNKKIIDRTKTFIYTILPDLCVLIISFSVCVCNIVI